MLEHQDESIYRGQQENLEKVKEQVLDLLSEHNRTEKEKNGHSIYEHILARVKSEESAREKCRRKGLPETAESVLLELHDAIGIRVVCRFIDDVFRNVEYIRNTPGLRIIEEKDYIRDAKPNGYRSYHMILQVTAPYEDILGRQPGQFYVEIQLRTLAMDSWASLEHELKYKKSIRNPEIITAELKRCADELNSCDLSMQTIRELIRGAGM